VSVNKVKLISEINDAFKDVVLGNGIGLSEADAIDSYADLKLRTECRQNDEKHNWNLITADNLNKYNCSLSFFDAEGMQFHLPAFMIADINEEYKFGMSFALTNLSDYSKSQFGLLSQKQRGAIRLFLEYILEHPSYEFERPEIKSAIESYWSK
jgi:hypothetical protein